MDRDPGPCQSINRRPSRVTNSHAARISYAYDVVHPPAGSDLRNNPPSLTNRRVFAFTDSGLPDGIKCDTEGNVYSGCGDGVHVSYGYLSSALR